MSDEPDNLGALLLRWLDASGGLVSGALEAFGAWYEAEPDGPRRRAVTRGLVGSANEWKNACPTLLAVEAEVLAAFGPAGMGPALRERLNRVEFPTSASAVAKEKARVLTTAVRDALEDVKRHHAGRW